MARTYVDAQTDPAKAHIAERIQVGYGPAACGTAASPWITAIEAVFCIAGHPGETAQPPGDRSAALPTQYLCWRSS